MSAGSAKRRLRDAGAPRDRILDRAVDLAVERLRQWGAEPERRTEAPADDVCVTVPTLSLAAYEAGRPDASLACRIGDERFIVRTGG